MNIVTKERGDLGDIMKKNIYACKPIKMFVFFF